MNIQRPKIVVVTPIKNEAWILPRFLAVTSQFADYIIVADQCSTDASVEICAKYPKVVLILNNSQRFNEADRQTLLLQKARDLVNGPKIILALDADEILAANAISTLGWMTMLQADPGTVLCFEKPDLYPHPNQCIRYDLPWPLGYVDDGAEHFPESIHSIRIPMPANSPRLYLHDIKFLHYGLARPTGQAAKMRMYSVLENIMQTKRIFVRRLMYSANKPYETAGRVQAPPEIWFSQWENLGIEMYAILNERFYWYDYAVLEAFRKYGTKRFWAEDIWSHDWEACRRQAVSDGNRNVPTRPIVKPPALVAVGIRLMTTVYAKLRQLKTVFWESKKHPGWL